MKCINRELSVLSQYCPGHYVHLRRVVWKKGKFSGKENFDHSSDQVERASICQGEIKFQNQHNIDPQAWQALAPKYWLALAPKYRRCHRARCLYDLKQSKTAERNNENGRFRGISETNSTSMFNKIWTVMKVFSSELSYNLARVMNYQE